MDLAPGKVGKEAFHAEDSPHPDGRRVGERSPGAVRRADDPVERLTAFAVDMSATPDLRTRGARSGTVDVTIERWSTQEEFEIEGALQEGGPDLLLKSLQKIDDPAGRSTRRAASARRCGSRGSPRCQTAAAGSWWRPTGGSASSKPSTGRARSTTPSWSWTSACAATARARASCCRSLASSPARTTSSTSRATRPSPCV